MKMQLAFISLLAGCALLVLPAQAGEQGRVPTYSQAEPSQAGQLIIREEGQPAASHAVKSIRMQIMKIDGDAHAALNAPNEPGRDPWKWVFYASLDVVTTGGWHLNNGGQCSPWGQDMAVCTIECDGGHFLLKRDPASQYRKLTLILRPIADLLEGDTSAAIRIGSCDDSDDAGDEVLLDVKSGSKARISFNRTAQE